MDSRKKEKKLSPRQRERLKKQKQAEIKELMEKQQYLRHGQFFTRLTITLIFIVIFGLLAIFTISTNYDAIFGDEPFATTEATVILIVLMLILPVCLIALIVNFMKEIKQTKLNKENEYQALFEDSEYIPDQLKDLDFPTNGSDNSLGLDMSVKDAFLEGEKEATPEGAKPEDAAPALTEEEQEELHEARFYMLSKLDIDHDKMEKPDYDNNIQLKEFCDLFREFASGTLGLYYDISDIRRFVAGLAVTHITILQGMSGTGKTSLAYAFGEFLHNSTVVVPIQPMWKERTDLIGYYNEFTKKFNETTLLQKLYEANYNDEIYITVLDEMNIARVEYYFAEFLSLLELPNPEKRWIDVVSDEWSNDPKLLRNGQLKLPKNMWFIGTANNDDSTFAISDKVYDRAMVINLDKKAKPFDVPPQNYIKVSASHLNDLYVRAQKEYAISERNQRRIRMLDKYLIETFKITFGNRIMKQIRAYVPVMVACGGTELEALDDILSKKVLRKLEAKNPVYVKNASNGLIAFIDDLFGFDMMPLCKEYIINFEQNA